MSRIIKRRELETGVSFTLYFERSDTPGSGFAFDCDEAGRVGALNPIAQGSYDACLTGTVDGKRMLPGRIERREWSHMRSGTIECDCGAHLDNDGRFTITCHRCGADYNGAGQRLADRSQWGEETGEHWSDCYGDGGFEGEDEGLATKI